MRMRILNQTLNPINETLEYHNNVVNNQLNIHNIQKIVLEDKEVQTDIPIPQLARTNQKIDIRVTAYTPQPGEDVSTCRRVDLSVTGVDTP